MGAEILSIDLLTGQIYMLLLFWGYLINNSSCTIKIFFVQEKNFHNLSIKIWQKSTKETAGNECLIPEHQSSNKFKKQLFPKTYSTQQTTVVKLFPNFLCATSHRSLRPISESLRRSKAPLRIEKGSPDDVTGQISILTQLLFIDIHDKPAD